MDDASVVSLSSLSSSCTIGSSIQLTSTDLQLLSLKGSTGDVSARSLRDYEEAIEEETPEMVSVFNKIGKSAYVAVQSRQLKPLHINKEKISLVRFHDILTQLSLNLDGNELLLLNARYSIPKSSTGINFGAFVKDFKRIGKYLNERSARYKMKWRQVTNKINDAGGLPDDGVFLEDLTRTTRPLLRNRSSIEFAVSGERPLQRESYSAVAAKSAAYSSAFASPFSSARGDDLAQSLRVALQTASEIDTLRGRIPATHPVVFSDSSRTQKHQISEYNMAPKLSFRNPTQTLLHMRGDKMGLNIMRGLEKHVLSDISDANFWLADPLDKISLVEVQDCDLSLETTSNADIVGNGGKKNKLPPILGARSSFVMPTAKKPAVNPLFFMNTLDELDQEELAAKAALEAEKAAEIEAVRAQLAENEKRIADSIKLIPDPVDSEFEIVIKSIQFAQYAAGRDGLLRLIHLCQTSSEPVLDVPGIGILKYHLARCYLLMGDLVSAKSIIDKFFTPLRMRTVFTDDSATVQDVAQLYLMCTMQVMCSSLIEARTLLEKLLSLTEKLLAIEVERSNRQISNEFVTCIYISMLLLKSKLLLKAGSLEASLSVLQIKVANTLNLLSSFFLEGLGDERYHS